MSMREPGLIAIQRNDALGRARWVHFRAPQQVLTATVPEQVAAVLELAEAARAKGLHAVGWIAYEAAPACDSALPVQPGLPGLPLAWFALYREEHPGLPRLAPGRFVCRAWHAALTKPEYLARVALARELIAAGECYQINFTTPLHAEFHGNPWGLFRAMRAGQQARHQAFIDAGDWILLSASPESLFRLENECIVCRPMKGTAGPGEAESLRASLKDQAENLMIVDMLRNDLGKQARIGSVTVSRLFEIETYPTLAQMCSTISARGTASAVDWFRALFPCASITGAPKVRAMHWIRALETGPRGVYTGAIGGLYADGVSEFNVAIRTALLHPASGWLRYDTGGGIVWDSQAEREYREARLKARIVRAPARPFALLETMRWLPATGVALWPEHRQRLLDSAAALGFALLPEALDRAFASLSARLREPTRIRLRCDLDGRLDWFCAPLPEIDARLAWSFAIDPRPTPRAHPESRHKTTRRGIYRRARVRCPQCDETLLINEDGELTEFSIGNLVLELNGVRYTPPLDSGLLNGVARRFWLRSGHLRERLLRREDLCRAEQVFLLNAVRGFQPMRWSESASDAPPVSSGARRSRICR